MLDDGRLTDGKGRTVSFANAVMILTSNLGSHFLSPPPESDEFKVPSTSKARGGKVIREITPELRELVMQSVRAHFRPEFLNRLDDIVLFAPLREASLRTIVQQQAAAIGKRLDDRDVKLVLSSPAVEFVLQEAWHPTHGARPLRRYLEQNVTTELSKMVLTGKLPDHSTVSVGVDAVSGKTPRLKFSVTPNGPEKMES